MVANTEGSGEARRSHNRHQADTFDRWANLFDQPLPDDVARRTEAIVLEADISAAATILDVGCGTGVLLPYILRFSPARVVACDLSLQMLVRARRKFGHSVAFIQADVADLPAALGPFDFVFCNACFDNFYDERLALGAINRLMTLGGRLIISHPMGRIFVVTLSHDYPDLIRRELPARTAAEPLLEAHGFCLVKFRDESDLYLAIAEKVLAI